MLMQCVNTLINLAQVSLDRTKTGVQSELLVFLHMIHWEMCPLHALGTIWAVLKCLTPKLFPDADGTTPAIGHVNAVLKSFGKTINEEFTGSHAIRHETAQFASQHHQIHAHWVIPRGGWTLENMQTLFTYVQGSLKTDSAVGLVLAGWPDISGGGKAPSDTWVPAEDRDLFAHWTTVLMQLPTNVDGNGSCYISKIDAE